MKRKENPSRIKKKRIAQGGGQQDGQMEDVDCPQGTDNVVQVIKEQHRAVEKAEKEISKKKRKLFDPKDVMPLDYEMEQAYKTLTLEGAEKDDKKYYRDGVFHEDEQKEKTEELSQKAQTRGLRGLDEPDDPGFWPPVEYDFDGIKEPAYTHLSEKTGKEYYLFPFTWAQIGTDWTICILGKRRSGKTRFVQSMLGNYLRPFFPRVYVFTKTKCSGEYSKFIPEAHIFEGFDQKKLDGLFRLQKKYKELRKQGKFHGNAKVLIILDDCLSDGFKYQKLVDEVFFEGRHLDICFVISSQDVKGINPACTGNADLAVTFNLRSERDKEGIRTKFCDFFKNDEDMELLTNQATHRKWHFVAYEQAEPSRNPVFTMFCGRATDPPPFVMGCKAWWKKNPEQLFTIVQDSVIQQQEKAKEGIMIPDLEWLLYTDDWGIIGEEEFNDVL